MTNEKLIKELQKYNLDLEKHLPNMDMSFFKGSDVFAEGEPKEEMLALLINEVNDLKTEVALTRKNLGDNVEGMVLRVLNSERNALIKQVNDFNVKMVANIRDTLGSYITQVNSEISTIRREFNQARISSENLTEMFNSSKNVLSDLSLSMSEFKSIRDELNRGLSEISTIRREFNQARISSENLTEMFNSSKNALTDISISMNEFKDIREELNLGLHKLNKRIDSANDNIKKIRTVIPHFDMKKELASIKTDVLENKKEIMQIEKVSIQKPKNNSIRKVNLEGNNTGKRIISDSNNDYLKKIISIDERIRKLDALK